MEPDLIFSLKRFDHDGPRIYIVLEIIDEKTLQWFERKYGNQHITYDGRIFTFMLSAEFKKLPKATPELWKALQKRFPEVIQKYILLRIKGEIDGME